MSHALRVQADRVQPGDRLLARQHRGAVVTSVSLTRFGGNVAIHVDGDSEERRTIYRKPGETVDVLRGYVEPTHPPHKWNVSGRCIEPGCEARRCAYIVMLDRGAVVAEWDRCGRAVVDGQRCERHATVEAVATNEDGEA